MKRMAYLVLALGVVVGMAAAAPRLVVDPEVYDFGTAMDGTVIRFVVTLKNSGDSTLYISSVGYNCSCTSYSLAVRTLNPGESTTMTVTFNTRNYSSHAQPVSQLVTIHSNDPARPELPIVVRGIVRTLAPYEGTASLLEQDFYVLVDLRSAEDYARGHLLGAVNIPVAELSAHLGELPKSKIIYLYDATGIEATQAVQLLQQNAFTLARVLAGGLLGWWQAYGDLFFVWAPDAVRTPPTGTPYYGTWAVVQPSQLAKKYQYVVDLRSPPTYAAGHFPGAENVALATRDELVAWAARLPRPIPGTSLAIWIVDEDGSQACDVAQYLQGIGFTQARCLFGGVAAWRAQFGDELLFPER